MTQTNNALLAQLVAARLRIDELEKVIKENGWQAPAIDPFNSQTQTADEVVRLAKTAYHHHKLGFTCANMDAICAALHPETRALLEKWEG